MIAWGHGQERSVRLGTEADAVYFLMFDRWKDELRSNRWHFASRWARHLPVVLLQPSERTPARQLRTEAEPRIPNTRILYLQSAEHWSASYLDDTIVQVGQVTEDMRRHGIRRPLLWCYNPNFVGLYAALPAVTRVLHATENYFHFDGVSDMFLHFHRTAIGISDLVVAVSDGVAASIRANVPEAPLVVITNGCDYEAYSRGVPDGALTVARRSWKRVAIYAGNINNRLDFGILAACAQRYRETLFAFFGPVHGLSVDDLAQWRLLLKEKNVRYFGPVSADALPGLYAAADVGMIPYKQTRVLVENGFPLKALEMCATGLPVVSTLMKPIQGLCDALVVATDDAAFIDALGGLSRDALSEAEQHAMRRVCRAHDYDRNFDAMIEALATRPRGRRPLRFREYDDVAQRIREVYAEHGRHAWQSRSRLSRWVLSPIRRLSRSRVAKAAVAIRVVTHDPGARRMLRVCMRRAAAVREAGVVRLLKDVLRLGLLGYEAKYAAQMSGALHVARRYDPAGQRLVFRTVCVHPSSLALREERLDAGPASPAGRIRQVIWDHSEAGHNVALIGGATRWPVFLGRDGVYEFTGIQRLLRQHPEAVSEALRQVGAGVASGVKQRRVSALMEVEREIEDQNRTFVEQWSHVASARNVDVDATRHALMAALDEAYRRRYPRLLGYVPVADVRGRRVLQLGLGAGVVGQVLLASGCDYTGLDGTEALATLMRFRVRRQGYRSAVVVQGSPLHVPFEDGTFDYVYFLDRFQAPGDLARVVGEIYRALRSGGRAMMIVTLGPLTRRELRVMLRDFRQVSIACHGPDAYVAARR